MITKAEYAEWLGKSESDITDAEFNRILRKGRARLEQALGYQLCPLEGLDIQFCPGVETPVPTQEEIDRLPVITLRYKPWQKFIEVPPFLQLYSVKYVDCDGDIYELQDCDYIVTQHSRYVNAAWNNTIELCTPLTCKLSVAGLGRGFACPGNCITVEVKAYWGLCCGELEDGATERTCCLPEDLKILLLDLMAESDSCDKSNIKRESSLSYTYEKFEKVDLLIEYESTINIYKISKPEEYPI